MKTKLLAAVIATCFAAPVLAQSSVQIYGIADAGIVKTKGEKAKLVAACEFVLEGLYAQNKISRNEEGGFEAVTKAKRDRRGMIYEDFTDIEGYN